MKLKVRIYEAKEGGYWAKVPALPGCVSQGETIEEVKERILEAIRGCIEVAQETATDDERAVEELEV